MKFNEYLKQVGERELQTVVDEFFDKVTTVSHTGESKSVSLNWHVTERVIEQLKRDGKVLDPSAVRMFNVLITWRKSMIKNYWTFYIDQD